MIPEMNATRRGGSAIPKPPFGVNSTWSYGVHVQRDPNFLESVRLGALSHAPLGSAAETIIEVGSCQGGSAAWLADTMHAYGYAFQIHSIDINQVTLQLPDVLFHKGDADRMERSFPPEFMRSQARPLLVIEDSSHDMTTSLAVLNFFHNWLAAGEYVVIEDGIITDMGYTEKYGGGPRAAVGALSRYPRIGNTKWTHATATGLAKM